jgi:isoamylase
MAKAGMHAGIIEDGSGVPTGTPLADPPLIEMISEDPVLRNSKLISEAWDCDGLFQVRAGAGILVQQ